MTDLPGATRGHGDPTLRSRRSHGRSQDVETRLWGGGSSRHGAEMWGGVLAPPEPMGLSVAEMLRQTHACSSIKMGNKNYGEQ